MCGMGVMVVVVYWRWTVVERGRVVGVFRPFALYVVLLVASRAYTHCTLCSFGEFAPQAPRNGISARALAVF